MKFPVIISPKISESYKDVLKIAKMTHRMSNDPYQMYCPYCGAPLIATERKEYMETLDEHVSCANVTKKTVYKCSAGKGCIGNMAMWSYTGEMYSDYDSYGEDLHEICYDLLYRNTIHKIGNWPQTAINSTMYYADLNTYCPGKSKEYKIQLFKHQSIVPVIIRKYEYDSFGKCKYVSYSVEYNIKDKTDSSRYIRISGIIKQINKLKWSIKVHIDNYRTEPTTKNLNILYGLTGSGEQVKSQSFINKIFYKYIAPFVFNKIMKLPKPINND